MKGKERERKKEELRKNDQTWKMQLMKRSFNKYDTSQNYPWSNAQWKCIFVSRKSSVTPPPPAPPFSSVLSVRRFHRELFTYFVHDLIRYDYGNNKLFQMNFPCFVFVWVGVRYAQKLALGKPPTLFTLTRQRWQRKTILRIKLLLFIFIRNSANVNFRSAKLQN